MEEPAYPDRESALVIEPGCRRCSELTDARQRIAWGNGNRDARIMVVGEAPGRGNPDADRWRGGNWTGMAYTARHSGRLIRSLFEELDYDRETLYYTNAVKCLPPDGPDSTREPTAAELERCGDHLDAELSIVDPEVLVPTGRHATGVVFDRINRDLDGFLDVVLEPVDAPELSATVLPLLHPAYEHVWRTRLGFDREGYVAAVDNALSAALA